MPRPVNVIIGLFVAGGPAACVRDPAPAICPEVAAGELVISELRGPQAGGDSYGQWLELFNGSGRDLDLEGTRITVTRIDGGDRQIVLVRRSVAVVAGDYAVLGRFADGTRPGYIDYGAGVDVDVGKPWFAAAGVEVDACGEVIDRLIYDGLPGLGTWSLGTMPPDAAGNDQRTAWCADQVPGPTTQLGVPGTPGESNHPCATP